MNALHTILKASYSDLVHTVDAVLHKQNKGYLIVPHKEKKEPKEGEIIEEVVARLHNPDNTPQIKDASDEDELAKAISKIVEEVVDNAKKLYQKHFQHLKEKVGDIRDDGKESVMQDKPTDIPHMCVIFSSDNEKRLRCLDKVLENKLIKVVEDDKKGKKDDMPYPTPTVLVAVKY